MLRRRIRKREERERVKFAEDGRMSGRRVCGCDERWVFGRCGNAGGGVGKVEEGQPRLQERADWLEARESGCC